LQAAGQVETREMYRTFNMGTGMILAVAKEHAASILAWLEQRLPGTAVVGEVTNNGHRVSHALEGVEFTHY
jgi:phosphoribosylformylglycinamidine cyclo-ligase